jgi:hypothetical protein
MKKTDKLILTVNAALSNKYGAECGEILSMLKAAAAADTKKGLKTHVVFLDDRSSFGGLKIKPLNPKKASEKDYKNIIDTFYKLLNPDYIVLFGAVDIIPQQKLNNLLYHVDGDDDRWIPSDLPYACNEPYSKDPNKFCSPVRVIGRLADINGIKDMDLMRTMMKNTSGFKTKTRAAYQSYFGVSADKWKLSTEKSLELAFGGPANCKMVPPAGPAWKKLQLKPLSHFYNCHGALSTPTWYGQKGNSYPEALNSINLIGEVGKNTVVAAECCYGAQLYKPVKNDLPDSMPICNTYFKNGAIAFLGSSTIAYGPAATNDQADLLTQYFFMLILGGASTGRALLEARQKYILNHGPDLSPTDLKTICQFYLLGDPSIQPVADQKEVQRKSLGIIQKKQYSDDSRKERRKYLLSKGTALAGFVNRIEKGKKSSYQSTTASVKKVLNSFSMRQPIGRTFIIMQNSQNKKTFRNSEMLKSSYQIYTEKKSGNDFSQKLLSIKELNGKIVNVQLYARR